MFTGSDVIALRQKTGAGVLDCKKALTETNGDMEKAVDYLREKGIATAAKKASRIAAEGTVYATVSGNTGVLVEVNCETDFVAKGDQFIDFVKDVADYVLANDVKDIDQLVADKNDETIAATAKIGEKIAIRRFVKYTTESGVVESYIHMGGKVGVLVEVEGCTCDGAKELAHDVALQIAAAKPLYLNASEVPAEVLDHEKEILRAQALNEGKPAAIVDRMVEGRVQKYYKDVCLLEQEFVKDPSMTVGQLVTEAIGSIGEKITVRRFARFEMGEGLEKKAENFADEISAEVAKAQANANK